MTTKILASATVGGNSGGTTSAVDTTGATVLVASVAQVAGSPNSPNISDSAGNTWSFLNNTNRSGSPGVRGAFYVCLNPNTSAVHTFTIADTNAHGSLCVAAFSTDNPNPTVDGLSGNFNNGAARPWQASSSEPGMVPTGPGELIVSAVAADNTSGAWVPDGGLSICAQFLGSSAARAGALAYGFSTEQPLDPSWTGPTANVIVGYVCIIG